MDGARLGSLTSAKMTSPWEDRRSSGRFYIGGTKNGALIGEALVICTDSLKEDFRFHIKQKGRCWRRAVLLGIQFRELFRDNLFFELASMPMHGDQNQDSPVQLGCELLLFSSSNMLFPILPNRVLDHIS